MHLKNLDEVTKYEAVDGSKEVATQKDNLRWGVEGSSQLHSSYFNA